MNHRQGAEVGGQAQFFAVPLVEALENRLLMNAAPVFIDGGPEGFWLPNNGMGTTIGINGFDADGDALTITATSDNPNVQIIYGADTNRYARLHFTQADGVTPIGDIVVQLFDDRALQAVSRFVTLATNHVNDDKTLDPNGTAFYTNVDVHRVISDFMIQTGDAAEGDGTGGSPLGDFDDAFDQYLSFQGIGVLAMANSGPDTNDSQFFITTGPATWLDQVHVIFGQVVDGWDTLETLNNVHTNSNDRPDEEPNNPPKMQSIDIFTSDSYGTITVRTTDNFTGDAHVTVTLDDGQGNQTSRVYDVRVLPKASTDDLEVAAGVQESKEVFDNLAGMDVTLNAYTDLNGATVSIDPDTHELLVKAPANYTGVFRVQVSGTAVGPDTLSLSQVFYFHSQPATGMAYDGRLRPVDAGGSIVSSAVVGKTMYVAGGTDGLLIYDMTDPAAPVLKGQVGDFYAQSVAVSGNTAYVIELWTGLDQARHGSLLSFDVSDPTNIELLDDVDLVSSWPSMVKIRGNYAYVAEGATDDANLQAGITIVDIRKVDDMVSMGTVTKPTPDVSFNFVTDIEFSGKYMWVTDYAGFVIVMDISRPTLPITINGFGTATSPMSMEVVGKNLFVVFAQAYDAQGQPDLTKFQGLQAYNIGNVRAISNLGNLSISNPWSLAIADGVAAVGGQDGYAFVDVSNPANLSGLYKYSSTVYSTNEAMLASYPSVIGNDFILPLGGYEPQQDQPRVEFGAALVRGPKVITNGSTSFTDDAGHAVSVSISSGTAAIYASGPYTDGIDRIEVANSTAASTLSISSRGGATTVGGIKVLKSLKAISAGAADLIGDLVVQGTLGSATFNNIGGDEQNQITINAAADASPDMASALSLKAKQVHDVDLTTPLSIKSISVGSWSDTLGNADLITAKSIGTLTSSGDFLSNVELSGAEKTLGSAKVAGSTANHAWSLDGDAGAISILGDVTGWQLGGLSEGLNNAASLTLGDVGGASVLADGAIGKITAKRWLDGSIEANSLGGLSITGNKKLYDGDFNVPLTLNGESLAAGQLALGKVSIAGSLTDTWTVTGNSGAISAKSIDSNWDATITGNLAGLSVSTDAGGSLTAGSIKSISVKGKYSDGVLTLTNDADVAYPSIMALGGLTVGGAMENVVVNSDGNIGAITVQSLLNSTIYASVIDTSSLPDDSADFVADEDLLASIKSLTVKGIAGQASYVNSKVAAWTIGTVSLKLVSGDVPFGLAAHQITSFSQLQSNVPYRWSAKTGGWPVIDDLGGVYQVNAV